MKEMEDLDIKARIDEISDKIDAIIKRVNDLEPDRVEETGNDEDDSRTP